MRYFNLFMLAIVLGVAFVVYDIKMESEQLAEYAESLQMEIEQEREDIRFYTAKWSALNQPQRLQGIVERYNTYLQLEPMEGQQITTLDALPVRPVQMEPASARAMGGYAGQLPVVE
ncbi:cell division protein FtsL [Polycladidibacter hongkongensis]|uniref:cell division protein FtsL n=1 Tax=Polycladidibacter hongkongensis TaxID=1647556 RepID=UPI000A520BB6|nr:hypothetical protein [Pseudovibrio hongkongensis]